MQPTKRQFNKAVKTAIEDGKIPNDADFKRVKIGEGYTAEYFLYWPHFNKAAQFRNSYGNHFNIGHASTVEQGSHYHKNFREWES